MSSFRENPEPGQEGESQGEYLTGISIVGLVLPLPPAPLLLRGLQGASSVLLPIAAPGPSCLSTLKMVPEGLGTLCRVPASHWLRWVGSPKQGYSGGGSAAWSPQQRAGWEGCSAIPVTGSKPI